MNVLKIRFVVPAIASIVGLVGAASATDAKIVVGTAYGQYVTHNVNNHCSIGNLTTNNACSGTTGTQCGVVVGTQGTLGANSTDGGATCANPKFRI